MTNTNDSGPGSLRQALAVANDGDTIVFDLGGAATISLTSGELVIGKNIAIIGLGPNLLTVSRAQNAANFRIFHITSGHTVTIEGLTISNGNAQGNFPGAAGGGIYSELSALSVNNCVITSNTALWGGGICNYGNANGAMIYLTNSSISSNLGLNAAGGIYNYSQGAFSSASLTVSNSTVNGNSSVEAGGIYNKTANGSDTLAINNSTISGNSANLTGGIENYAIGTNATATLTIANSTLSSNSALFKGGSAITNGGGTNGRDSPSAQSQATLGNTILNSDGSSPNIENIGIFTSLGYNLSSDDGAGVLNGPGDQINTDPILGPLQGNGGPTFTHALLPGSPAIDAGDPNFTPPPFNDQRGPGFDRVVNGRIDKGSFEVQGPAATPTPTATPCASVGAWTEQAPYPISISGAAGAAEGGNIYTFGGLSAGTPTTAAYKYTPATDSWSAIAPLPAARYWFTAVSDGTYVYLLGGLNQNGFPTTATLWRYDPVSNTYNTSLPSYTIPTYFHASAYLNGKIYRIAGRGITGTDYHVEVYNIATNSWSMAANFPGADQRLMAAALGGYIYAGGGDGPSCYRYDPVTDTWTPIASLPVTRSLAASDAYNGRWVLAGGDIITASASVIAYDAATNTWTSLPDMLQANDQLVGVTVGQAFHVLGGSIDNEQFIQEACATPTPMPTATPTVTSTPMPTATPTPTPTAASTPIPTSTPTPTPTARPTPSPRSSPSPRSRPTPPPRPALLAR